MRPSMLPCWCILALVLAAEVQAQVAPKPDAATLKKFEGTWRIDRDEQSGKASFLDSAERTRTMTVEGNRYIVRQKGAMLWEGTIEVVSSRNEIVELDLVNTDRTDGLPPGDVVPTIWMVKGDTLHTAGAFDGAPRPPHFRTQRGSQWTYKQWKRVGSQSAYQPANSAP